MRRLEITEDHLFATIGRLYIENQALSAQLDRLEQAIREAQAAEDNEQAEEE